LSRASSKDYDKPTVSSPASPASPACTGAKFLAFNAIGAAAPSVTVWTSVGYLSANHINTIYNTAKQYELDFAIALGALLIAYIARRIYRSRNNPPPPDSHHGA
jgi:hypothetical protein